MKEFTNKEWDVMLCSTGYLPPRNDEELMFFNQMYEGYTPNEDEVEEILQAYLCSRQ